MTMTEQGGRKFYEQFPQNDEVVDTNETSEDRDGESQSIFKFIAENVIGKDLLFNGPFGKRKVVHCDFTASARCLRYMEDYIQGVVLPHYGNTHTTTSVTSLQTTMFRDESRDIIRKSVNASENDVVIFTGNGCTAAVHKFIHALNFQKPPVVFVSPFEHHSNLLPWKEIDGKIVWTNLTKDGGVDYSHLESNLKEYQSCGRPLIGCYSAASNITGTLVDTDAVAVMLHKYNALAFFDYATAGPYAAINMNPTNMSVSNLSYKDAIFLSPHKFVGGPGSPGILVAKKSLFVNPVPSGGGGGSVFYVTASTHRYLKEIEIREEGGTPDLIGSIRAGLVFQLKDNIKPENIIQRDKELIRNAFDSWSHCPYLIVLGSNMTNKLPVFSFVVKHGESGRLLHHNYVSVLLNDLFGIQSRGGCACAGPYAQQLLGMSEDVALEIESLLLEDQRLDRHHLRRHREYSDKEILRPGFTRINLPYFYDDGLISFIVKAISLIAEHGWKLLPQYLFNPDTGEWKYRNFQLFKDRKWIGSIKYKNGKMVTPSTSVEEYQDTLSTILKKGEEILLGVKKSSHPCGDQTLLFGEEGERLRWFLLPCEAQDYLNSRTPDSCRGFHMPFFPGREVSTRTQKSSNENSTYSPHYCSCSPLHLEEIINSTVDGVPNEKNVQNGHNAALNGEYDEIRTRNVGNLANLRNDINEMKKENENNSSSNDDSNSDNNRTSSKDLNLENEQNVDSNSKHNLANLQNENNLVSKKQHSANNEDKNNNQNKSKKASKQAQLVCSLKPEPKVTSSTQDTTANGDGGGEEEVPYVIKFHNPPKQIFKAAVEGLEAFEMIQNKDRVLLCLSGGKDSLSMLQVIHQYKFYAKSKGFTFDIGAVTVDPQSAGYDPSPLKEYLRILNVPYFYEEQDIIGAAADLAVCESICSYCSRMKRGRIYACARREGYNVIALGQHLDDIAESFLMSTFHNGYLRSMKANYMVREGDLRVIRPLIYVREKDLRQFAEKVKLPVIPENCPACFEAPKERHRMKQLLAQQEVQFPNLFKSLRSALHPLISKSKTGLEKRDLGNEVNGEDHDEDEDDI